MKDFVYHAVGKAMLKPFPFRLVESYVGSSSDMFLYGSRDMADDWGNVSHYSPLVENSDWDFAVRNSLRVENYLVMDGWKEKKTEAYKDATTFRVYDKEIDGYKIQISLRDKFDAFKSVWNNIPQDFYWKYINKKSKYAMSPDEVSQYISSMAYVYEAGFNKGASESKKSLDHKTSVKYKSNTVVGAFPAGFVPAPQAVDENGAEHFGVGMVGEPIVAADMNEWFEQVAADLLVPVAENEF